MCHLPCHLSEQETLVALPRGLPSRFSTADAGEGLRPHTDRWHLRWVPRACSGIGAQEGQEHKQFLSQAAVNSQQQLYATQTQMVTFESQRLSLGFNFTYYIYFYFFKKRALHSLWDLLGVRRDTFTFRAAGYLKTDILFSSMCLSIAVILAVIFPSVYQSTHLS